MSNQDNKLTDTLDKLDYYIKQLRKRIESQNTKADDGPSENEWHDNYRTCIRNDYEDDCAYDWRITKKEKITRKFRFEEPKFYGYSDPHAFSNWLVNIECYFDNYEMSDLSKIDLLIQTSRTNKILLGFYNESMQETV